MRRNIRTPALAAAVVGLGLAAAPALADFAGQPILGPITLGDTVNGDTTGAADDNDGFTSGDHFFDIWNGPDDVWQLNWPGGPMLVTMTYDPVVAGDLDLFLYEPGSYDDSGNYSILNTGVETIVEPNAPAGTYYLNIDSVAPDAGAYTLSVALAPEPSSAVAAIGAIGLAALRRGRRA